MATRNKRFSRSPPWKLTTESWQLAWETLSTDQGLRAASCSQPARLEQHDAHGQRHAQRAAQRDGGHRCRARGRQRTKRDRTERDTAAAAPETLVAGGATGNTSSCIHSLWWYATATSPGATHQRHARTVRGVELNNGEEVGGRKVGGMGAPPARPRATAPNNPATRASGRTAPPADAGTTTTTRRRNRAPQRALGVGSSGRRAQSGAHEDALAASTVSSPRTGSNK